MNFIFLGFVDFLKNAGNLILTILLFAVVIGVIIGIHELGHMIFARRAGVLCREYAIGMGPVLWKKKKGEILYSLRALPLGGFCSIAGETVEEDPFKNVKEIKLDIKDGVIKGFYLDITNDKEDKFYRDLPLYNIVSYDIYDEKQTGKLFMEVEKDGVTKIFKVDPQAIVYFKKEEYQIAPYNRTLGSKNKRQRALVMFGGPLMNFVLAIFVFLIVGLCSGFPNYKSNELGSVSEETPIAEVLQEGDKIIYMETVSLGGSKINSWNDLMAYMDEYDKNYLAETIMITADRDGQEISVFINPFIAINNAGFGSYYDYDKKGTVVGAYADLGADLGDNSQLKLNDKITSIWLYGETPIQNPTWKQVRTVFGTFVGDNEDENYNKVYMTVLRNVEGVEKTLEIAVEPYSKYLMENQTSIGGGEVAITDSTIGISCTTRFRFFQSIGYAFQRTWESLTAVVDTFKLLFSGSVSVKNLSGPIGIYSITAQAAQYGVLYVLSLVGLLSVNIGALNLLPIPALDGGRLVFVGYEAITKKKPNPKVETILITVTMILLLGLMIIVAYEDILRLIK
ncbi:MAG: site-2 protease family protein [Bacilli bacterium]|nr:site-2 protease family protein [Bacilli bacterium]